MPQQNVFSLELNQQDIAEINKAIATLKAKLMPALKSINYEEKNELPKMGDKTIAFVTKAMEHCESNPDLVPPFLDTEEFKKDMKAIETLRSFYSPLEQVTGMLSDSMILAGSDAYSAALMFYGSVKSAKKSNVAKAGSIYDDLSSRFSGKKVKKESK